MSQVTMLEQVGYASAAAIGFGALLVLNARVGEMLRRVLEWGFGSGEESAVFNFTWFKENIVDKKDGDWGKGYVEFTNGWTLFFIVIIFDLHGVFSRWLSRNPGLFPRTQALF